MCGGSPGLEAASASSARCCLSRQLRRGSVDCYSRSSMASISTCRSGSGKATKGPAKNFSCPRNSCRLSLQCSSAVVVSCDFAAAKMRRSSSWGLAPAWALPPLASRQRDDAGRYVGRLPQLSPPPEGGVLRSMVGGVWLLDTRQMRHLHWCAGRCDVKHGCQLLRLHRGAG